MPISASRRFGSLVQSDIRRMTRECDRLGGINMGQGICDLPTPLPVAEGAIEAIRQNRAVYSPYEGIAPLRKQIARVLGADGLEVDPDREIVVTIGATGAFAAALVSLLDPGDEILLFEPYYGYHRNQAAILGLTCRSVTLEAGSWRLDPETLRRAVGPKTRAVVVNTPANPSGKVFGEADLDAIGALCREHDLLAITDEIYDHILYDGRRHLRLAARPGMSDRTVTISGFSKTFSVTGWRLGYAAAVPALAGPIGLAADLLCVCAPTPLQWGAARGLESLPPSFYTELSADYQRKRDQFLSALGRAGLVARPPEGAYYVLADISGLGFTSASEAARSLLEDGKVAAIPGTAFYDGPEGERFLRFCFAKDDESLDVACQRVEAWGKARRGA